LAAQAGNPVFPEADDEQEVKFWVYILASRIDDWIARRAGNDAGGIGRAET
jgi:hypothetical protein